MFVPEFTEFLTFKLHSLPIDFDAYALFSLHTLIWSMFVVSIASGVKEFIIL